MPLLKTRDRGTGWHTHGIMASPRSDPAPFCHGDERASKPSGLESPIHTNLLKCLSILNKLNNTRKADRCKYTHTHPETRARTFLLSGCASSPTGRQCSRHNSSHNVLTQTEPKSKQTALARRLSSN